MKQKENGDAVGAQPLNELILIVRTCQNKSKSILTYWKFPEKRQSSYSLEEVSFT